MWTGGHFVLRFENWLKNQEPIGSNNVIVEINESLIVKRKYNRGRLLSQIWLFGGKERVSKKLILISLIDEKRVANG